MLTWLRRHRVGLLHASFWGVYFSFFFYQSALEIGGRAALAVALIPMGCSAAVAYFTAAVLLPRWLRHHRWGQFLAELAGPFALAVGARVALQRQLLAGVLPAAYLHSRALWVSAGVGTLFLLVFIGALHFALDWFTLEARTRALENEHLLVELKFLRAQINPHFLFNTLNNLYYLAYTHSPQTPDVIARLAHMMRYLLHEATHATVPLTQEIEHLQNYLALERLRLNVPVPLELEVVGEPAGVAIAPLLLFTFLENAVKHGVRTTDSASWVKARVRLVGPRCEYVVRNSCPATPLAATTGTGLPNVRRRLALSYPGRHTLQVSEQPNCYTVHLTLDLTYC